VGGLPRDLLFGLPTQAQGADLDLAVEGDALALGRELAARLGVRFVLLSQEQAACRLPLPGGGYLDLVGLRAPGILNDLAARDFTVNALASPLTDLLAGRPKLLDPTGGLADLAARRLRLAGPQALYDDPLRVLRAFRFMASHGLRPVPGLMDDLAAAGPGLFRVAVERIGQEWLKLAAGPQAGDALQAMDQAQVLTRLLPHLAPGRALTQNPFHHLDVLGHALATAAALGDILGDPKAHLGALAAEAGEYQEQAIPRAVLVTAALLHDLGKPATRAPRQPGWASFYRHDLVGCALAQAAARRLDLSKAQSLHVARLVGLHMRPFHLLGVQARGALSDRALRRLLQDAGPDLGAVFLLALADTMAGRGPQRPPDAEARLLDLWRLTARRRDEALAQALAAPPLVKGRELMAHLGLEPGPEVGRLLARLRRAQQDGRISDPAEALALARRLRRKRIQA
jgi:tRNA nucleotidyltransferase/poly(A) polymerase